MAYKYHSIPPLLADLGQLEIDVQNLNINIEVQILVEEDFLLEVKVLDAQFQLDPILVFVDGVSDTSDLLTRVLTTVTNIIRDRLVSITKFARLESYSRLN